MKGCPYDNAVAEATLKTIKTEFVKRRLFESLEILNHELHDYVNWFNRIRIYQTLGYLIPIEYKQLHLNKIV
jgi:putative transposase